MSFNKTTLLLCFITALVFFQCKKDNDSQEPQPSCDTTNVKALIIGKWSMTLSIDGQTSDPLEVEFMSNGTYIDNDEFIEDLVIGLDNDSDTNRVCLQYRQQKHHFY